MIESAENKRRRPVLIAIKCEAIHWVAIQCEAGTIAARGAEDSRYGARTSRECGLLAHANFAKVAFDAIYRPRSGGNLRSARQGLQRHLPHDVSEDHHGELPGGGSERAAALSGNSRTSAGREWLREVRRVLPVRRRVPRELYLHRSCGKYGVEAHLRRRALRKRLQHRLLALHLLRILRRGVPHGRHHPRPQHRTRALRHQLARLPQGTAPRALAAAYARALRLRALAIAVASDIAAADTHGNFPKRRSAPRKSPDIRRRRQRDSQPQTRQLPQTSADTRHGSLLRACGTQTAKSTAAEKATAAESALSRLITRAKPPGLRVREAVTESIGFAGVLNLTRTLLPKTNRPAIQFVLSARSDTRSPR